MRLALNRTESNSHPTPRRRTPRTPASEVQRSTYYPTTTALADGKALVLSGDHHQKHTFFSGKRNSGLPTGTVADSVAIFSPVAGGQWEQSIIPAAAPGTPGRPEARWLHSAAQMEQMTDFKAQVYFGGKDDQGEPLNDTWLLKRDKNVTGADFAYRWERFDPSGAPFRSGHTAIAVNLLNGSTPENNMVVFGGLDDGGAAKNTTHRLHKQFGAYQWSSISTSNPPSARHGHTAIYDETTISGTPTRRMIVFGGAGSNGSVLPDNSVYELRFGSDPTTATWYVMQQVDLGVGTPTPRFGHVMAIDPQQRTRVVQGQPPRTGHAALMFGGQTDSNTYSDELWILWIFNDGTVGWEEKGFGGQTPPARARASMLLDTNQGDGTPGSRARLYLFGGEDGDGDVDLDQFVVDPWGSSYPMWAKWAATDRSASGHTVLIDQGLSTVRVAEVFDPAGGATGDFTKHPSSQLFQFSYPPTFVIPGGSTPAGRVLTMAVDNEAYYLDVAANGGSSAWTKLTSANLGFACEAGVMYRPGRILMAGMINSAGTLVGRSKKLDATNLTSSWLDAGPQTGTGSFAPRRFHNLVLLPNGQVMAVGGIRSFNSDDTGPEVYRPQIWDPDANQGAGVWTDSSLLAVQPHRRNYHSTAMLLPDGRVVSAGGEKTNEQYMGEIFCPPYLFNGDNPATRPTLIAATGRWRYNADVTFAVNSGTTIERAALIRAPATTHGFDESQRYVPLDLDSSYVRYDGIRQYFLKAPPDSFHAPPGDYLLFVSNAAGVPAIAQWVRVGSTQTGQFDTTAPSDLTFSTTFIYCNEISPITWNAPGDDGEVGTAQDYEVRYSFSPITSQNFPQATIMTAVDIPHLFGSPQTGNGFSGLNPATMVYVAGRTWDKAGNPSSLAYAEFATLPSCEGGGGYGTSAGRTRDEASRSRTPGANAASDLKSRGFARPTTILPQGSPLRLIGEFERGESTRWRIAYRDLTGDADLLSATSSQAAIQEPRPDGSWQTLSAATLLAGSVGVRSLPRDGRVVFPFGTSIESLELEPRSYVCAAGDHSRLGDLLEADSLDLASEFTTSDTLTLAFSTATQPGEGVDCFFRVHAPGEPRTAASRPRGVPSPRDPQPNDLPLTFALHTARPNPFSSATTMRFDLPRSAEVTLEMFDVQGRLMAVLARGTRDAGRHSVVWDGRTGGGRAPAGVYLCRMTAGGFVTERRVSLLP